MLELIRRLLRNMEPSAGVQDYYEDGQELKGKGAEKQHTEEDERQNRDYVADVYAQL